MLVTVTTYNVGVQVNRYKGLVQ